MYFKCFQFSLFPLSKSPAWEYLVSTHHYINQQYLVSNTAKRTISYQQHQYFMRRVRQEEVNAISFQESIIFINGLRIVTTKYSSHLTFWKAFYFFSEINWGICLLKPWTNTLSQWLRSKIQAIIYAGLFLRIKTSSSLQELELHDGFFFIPLKCLPQT